MIVVGVIPARWASTRFKGKILAPIAGKPMIEHVYTRAKRSKLLNDLWVACDERIIYDAVKTFGGKAVMTSPDHTSGTDRIAEAVKDIKADVVINIQGDEPLIHPSIIDSLGNVFLKDPKVVMATVIKEFESAQERNNPNCVKVIVDKDNNAVLFSRNVIVAKDNKKNFKHLGIYAYKKDFLLKYKDLPESTLEKKERLEQLRAIEAGYSIKTVLTDKTTIGVDAPEDVARVEAVMANEGKL